MYKRQGQYLAIQRESGQVAYLDGKNWYSDLGATPLSEPYPVQFGAIAASYLEKIARNTTATKNMLLADRSELVAQKEMLATELSSYEVADSLVNFGTRKLPREEAIRLTQLVISKIDQQIQSLDKHMQELPGNADIVQVALAKFAQLSSRNRGDDSHVST